MFTLLWNLFSRSLLVLLVAMLSVNYLPDTLFKDFPFEPLSVQPNNYDSVIPEWNSKLSDSANVEYIQLNNILGPESIAVNPNNGLLYTGLADGRLVELNPSKNYKLRQVLRFVQSPRCLDNIATRATECGRFLQMRFVNNTLFALESSSGLYKIDVKAGTKTLVGPSKPSTKNILYNAFAFDPKEPNIVYITISSTRWNLQKIMWSLMELETTGSIIALDISTGKRVTVLDSLMLANGIDADGKRDQLVFAESTRSQVSSLSLRDVRAAFKLAKDGDKLSNMFKTPLIPVLPGSPDNIIIESDLAYIALPLVKPNGKELLDELSTMSTVRKAYGRLVYGSGKLLEHICEKLYYHPQLETVYRELVSGHINYRIVQSDKSAVIEYNLATGTSRLLGSNNFSFISEAVRDNKGNLLLGSFRSPFIVKVTNV